MMHLKQREGKMEEEERLLFENLLALALLTLLLAILLLPLLLPLKQQEQQLVRLARFFLSRLLEKKMSWVERPC